MDVFKHVRSNFGHLFEDVCGFIIRPERADYVLDDLGPPVFRLGEGQTEVFVRRDLELQNMRGMTIKASWFQPQERSGPMACVVYLHGNCGSRCDALEILFLLQHGFSIFAYDACGSGKSDGQYVSLGFYERQDLAAVVEYLQGSGEVKTIGLWGRSMGAVTSIMYCAKDPTIHCLVADSPFSNLKQLCRDLVAQHGKWVPVSVVKVVVNKIRKKICKMAGFDLNDLDAVRYASQCEVPAFIFHGEKDTFVAPQHSLAVDRHYRGSCIHKLVKGDHNSRRGPEATETATAFLRLYLIEKPDAAQERKRQQQEAQLGESPEAPTHPHAQGTAPRGSSYLNPVRSPQHHFAPHDECPHPSDDVKDDVSSEDEEEEEALLDRLASTTIDEDHHESLPLSAS